MARIFLIILDSLGIGAAPDADDFGDAGANTLLSCSKTGILSLPNLKRLGISCIEGVEYLGKIDTPMGLYGKMEESGKGKDTTSGHWEIAGIRTDHPMPTYPNGFPPEIIEKFEKAVGVGTLCNLPYSGTEVIKDYGDEHIRTKKLIVYTSADSVFQIAACEALYPPSRLYEICETARNILIGKDAVGRVIARPFIKDGGEYKRTANRRDFSVKPPRETLLDKMKAQGLDVISVGKINDIFAGMGITESITSHSNSEGMDIAISLTERCFSGLAFINLVDFDSSFGHRQDPIGYASALNEFDIRLGEFISKLSDGDTLIITADHGCDPSDDSTDHTREYVPLLIYNGDIKPASLGTLKGFGSVAKFIADKLGVDFTPEAYQEIKAELK